MKETVFRRASSSDVFAVADLLGHLGYVHQVAAFAPVFEHSLTEKNLDIILAEDGQSCLGLLTLLTSVSLRLGGPLVSIEELVVHPDVRGRSLGGRLVDKAKKHALRSRAVVLEVHTTMSRESFKRQFYTKNGFVLADSSVLRWKPPSANFPGHTALDEVSL